MTRLRRHRTLVATSNWMTNGAGNEGWQRLLGILSSNHALGAVLLVP